MVLSQGFPDDQIWIFIRHVTLWSYPIELPSNLKRRYFLVFLGKRSISNSLRNFSPMSLTEVIWPSKCKFFLRKTPCGYSKSSWPAKSSIRGRTQSANEWILNSSFTSTSCLISVCIRLIERSIVFVLGSRVVEWLKPIDTKSGKKLSKLVNIL